MAKVTKGKGKEIRAHLHEMMHRSYPIKEHMISSQDEYVKNLYIEALCVVAEYENDDVENACKFIERIMVGSDMKSAIQEHVRRALEIKIEDFDEFILQCKEKQLSNAFLLDCLLITCANGVPNEKQIEFVAELAQALGIERTCLMHLGKLAKSILEQNSDGYAEVLKEIPKDLRVELEPYARCYVKEFVVGVLVDSDDVLWLYSKEKASFDLDRFFEDQEERTMMRKRIVIENLIVEGTTEKPWTFSNAEEVVLKNCEFYCQYFDFVGVKNIVIEKCLMDMRKKECEREDVVYFDGCKNLNINDSCFQNTYLNAGHLFYATTAERVNLTVENSRFQELGSSVAVGTIMKGANGDVKLTNCKFSNCQGCSLFSSYYMRMSHNWVEENDCEFTNCCSLT